MAADDPARPTTLYESASDIALVDEELLVDQAKHLVAMMCTLQKISGDNASVELMRIHAEMQSDAYLRVLAERTAIFAATYALEAAPIVVGIILLRNFGNFVDTYRRLRTPAPTVAPPSS